MGKTVFDFNISAAELNELDIREARDFYIKEKETIIKLYHLYMLMKLRGDDNHAMNIVNLVRQL